jgi:hypothetical protein
VDLRIVALGLLSLFAAGTGSAEPVSVEVIAREGWRARPPSGSFVKHVIKHLTVHHSGAPLRDNRRAPDRIRSAQLSHQGRGWPELAYHFLIDGEGPLYQGRPLEARGDTHTRYDTTGHFLVCVVGDYDRQPLKPVQLASLIRILAWGASRFAVSPGTIRGHRELARTSCPGKHLQALIADGSLRRQVEQLLAGGRVRMRLLSGAEARARVERIRRPASGSRSLPSVFGADSPDRGAKAPRSRGATLARAMLKAGASNQEPSMRSRSLSALLVTATAALLSIPALATAAPA